MSIEDKARQTSLSGCRVAVIGARGIGRHHANWWSLSGADVCAIVGTVSASVAESAAALRTMFRFGGRTYTDVGDMLRTERPTIVDVCSPPAWHYEHVQAALTAGAHVLCEKPFLYDAALPQAELLRQAETLLAAAAARGQRLALCSQYYVVAGMCLRLYERLQGRQAIREIGAELASPVRGRVEQGQATWVDLGPHLLAAVQALVPGADLDANTLSVEFAPGVARCAFVVRRGPEAVPCRLHVHRTEGEPSHVRKLSINGVDFDLQGFRDQSGVYRARIVSGAEFDVGDDPMHTLIRAMGCGRAALAGAGVLQNQAWLLAVLGRSR